MLAYNSEHLCLCDAFCGNLVAHSRLFLLWEGHETLRELDSSHNIRLPRDRLDFRTTEKKQLMINKQ